MDLIAGGLAQGKTPKDFDITALKQGIRVEMEHTDNAQVAREIAMDHLTEDPEYYDKLQLMENGACDKYLSKAIPVFLSKGKYWRHVDGSLWWRNPESNRIEPYHAQNHADTGQEPGKAKEPHVDVESLKEIPTKSLSGAVFAARKLVAALNGGSTEQQALGQMTKDARASARVISDPKDLNDKIKAYTALGFREAANVFMERLREVAGEFPDAEPVKPQPLGDNEVMLDGERLPFKVLKKGIGGSTGAYIAEVGGKKYVVKEYRGNESQVKNEFLANLLYNNFNLYQSPATQSTPAPGSKIAELKGKKTLFSPFIDGVVTLEDKSPLDYADDMVSEEIQNALRHNFVLDAWLANWDVIGLTEDNVGVSTKTGIPMVTRLDNGGALLFRAQGTPKGNAFGDKVTELDTMRDFDIAPTAAEYFGNITDNDLIESLSAFERKMQKIGASGLYELVSQSGYSDDVAKGLTSRLMNRFDSMLDYRDRLKKKQAQRIASEGEQAQSTGYHPSGDSAYEEFKEIQLNPMERLSIKAFTKLKEEDDPRNYYQINEAPAKGNWTEEAVALEKAIDQLPRIGALTMRGVGFYEDLIDHWDNWTSGNWAKVEWKAFSSSTLHPGMTFDAEDGLTFIIKNKGIHGRYVAPASDSTYEDEVLYKPGARFKVVGFGYTDKTTISMGHTATTLGNSLILEEVSDEEFDKMDDNQPPPKQYSQEEVYNLIKDTAKPTSTDSLREYKKENPF